MSRLTSRPCLASHSRGIMPAASAEVSFTPHSMQIENRKLPNSDSTNKSRLSRADSGASPGWRRSHGSIATAAMPKRSIANRNTGNTATSSLDSPT